MLTAFLRVGASLLCADLVMVVSLAAAAQSQPVPDMPKVNEFYVRYKAQPGGALTPGALLGLQRAMTLSNATGVPLAHVRTLDDGAEVMRSDRLLTRAEAWEVAEKLARSGGVALAEPINPELNARPPARPVSSLPPPIGRAK